MAVHVSANVKHRRQLQILLLGVFALTAVNVVAAHAPVLYSQPAYESPVSAEPDDILMLGGYGFASDDVVVYEAIGDTGDLPVPPASVPDIPSADVGYAAVVSSNNVPYALTVRLPRIVRAGMSYALWVRSTAGEWSTPIKINDGRPLWLTPAYVYASAAVAGLPRYLKVVGRNLRAHPGSQTRVRLSGPQTWTQDARPTGGPMDSYVATIALPALIRPGRYHVALSRDGSNWLPLEGQELEVRTDPATDQRYAVDDRRFGGCHADDGRDATACVVRAIAAAAAGGGTVYFGRGNWTLVDSRSPGVIAGDGIIVPQGVKLRGAGRGVTRLIRDRQWNAASPTATFTLTGNNRVEGFTFTDTQRYVPADRIGPVLQIGENSERLWALSHSPGTEVRDLVITNNQFDHTDTAIADGGLGMDRLFITYNEFGTYRTQLELRGDVFNMTNRFRIDDSVIAHNVFKPGSFLQVADRQGSIASEVGASLRLDFSDNFADGAATEYLYAPNDPKGWRAAFFWHMNDNHEMLLMSANVATCTGDKTGDGESIALDSSGNTLAFDAIRPVLESTKSSVTVAGPLAARQNGRQVPLATYYVGHWLQIGDGPGIGQARRITAYRIDAASGRITFTVSPNWDVEPVTGVSRVSVGREFWQAYIIGNRIDHRRPLCQKSNRELPVGGVITLWAQLADSVVAGNQLYDTEGITFHENYNSPTLHCDGCGSDVDYQSSLSIRDNLVEGRYDSASSCTASGITGWVSAAPDGTTRTPTLGWGIDISHNRLVQANNTRVGAIAVGQGWYDGPIPHEWPIVENLIVQHNEIEGIQGPITGRACAPGQPRLGISFPGSKLTWKTVLYANECTGVAMPLGHDAKDTTRVCPDGVEASCECQASVSVH